ncbi:MAG: hypothetical protein N3B16_01980 [Candidatus Aminicenantes bacterium]|nr:hypothetical protein [Candidatus Aminicenantes bacterium]
MRVFLIVLLLTLGLILALWLIRQQGQGRLESNLIAREKAMVELTKVNLTSLEKIVLNFLSQEGRLPSNLDELRRSRLLVAPAVDAWGREIRLELSGETGFRLISSGPDGQFGTIDDITLSHEL